MTDLYVITDTRGVDQFIIKATETNTDTDLELPGKGAPIWGENLDENLYRLMENFAVEEKGGSPGNPQDASDLGAGNGINNPLEGQNWWNITQKKLYVFDGTDWQKIGTSTGSVAPSPASEGDLWFDDVAQQLKVYNGATFVSTAVQYLRLDGASIMTGNLDVGTNLVRGVVDPLLPDDAATMNYVDSEIADLTSDLTTGVLLDSRYVEVAGDTMAGDLNMGTNVVNLTNLPVAGTNAANKTYVDNAITTLTIIVNAVDGFKPGDIKASASPGPLTGYLLCDGAAVSRIGEADLFAAIGTTYGIGDGATTFNIPNLVGKFPLGEGGGHSRGDPDTGEETHVLSVAEMPAHTHTYLGVTGGGFSGGGGFAGGFPPTSSTGGNAAHNNMPPFAVINYFIKT